MARRSSCKTRRRKPGPLSAWATHRTSSLPLGCGRTICWRLCCEVTVPALSRPLKTSPSSCLPSSSNLATKNCNYHNVEVSLYPFISVTARRDAWGYPLWRLSNAARPRLRSLSLLCCPLVCSHNTRIFSGHRHVRTHMSRSCHNLRPTPRRAAQRSASPQACSAG